MNTNTIIPQPPPIYVATSAALEDCTCAEKSTDDEPMCFCGLPLETENEILNATCYSCFAVQQSEIILDNFDEVESVLRSVVRISPVVEHDIRTSKKAEWQKLIESIRCALSKNGRPIM